MSGDPFCQVHGDQLCDCSRKPPDPFERFKDPLPVYAHDGRRKNLEELLERARTSVKVQQHKGEAIAVPTKEELLRQMTAYLGDAKFAQRFADCMEIIRVKNSDYTQGEGKWDRIAHFRDAAEDLQLPMLKIWQVFVRKHWAVIQKYANGGPAESEPIDGRINDVINYMVLFGAIIDDIGQDKA